MRRSLVRRRGLYLTTSALCEREKGRKKKEGKGDRRQCSRLAHLSVCIHIAGKTDSNILYIPYTLGEPVSIEHITYIIQ